MHLAAEIRHSATNPLSLQRKGFCKAKGVTAGLAFPRKSGKSDPTDIQGAVTSRVRLLGWGV